MIIEALEVVAALAAAGYAAHRIENALLAAKGFDTRNLFKPLPATPPPAAPVAEILPPWSEQDRQREAVQYKETNAPWLDPNRYGERPDWRHDLLPRQTRGLIDAEKERQAFMVNYAMGLATAVCPVCRDNTQTGPNTAGSEVTLWDCRGCGAEFTKKGETAKSKRKRDMRNLNAQITDAAMDLPLPPAMSAEIRWMPGSSAYKPDRTVRGKYIDD